MRDRRDALAGVALFVGCGALLWWLAGQRLIFLNDEGIYLDGAWRMVEGSLPYRDFFVLTGPGTYWNLFLVFKLFGKSLGAARLLAVVDLAVIAVCIYWLASKLHSRTLGVWLSLLYVALLTPQNPVVNHRWDSAAFSMVSIVFLAHGLRARRRWPVVAAGAAAAYAAWITPPMLVAIAPMAAWIAVERRWGGVCLFASGIAGVSASAVILLLATGSLQPMIHHLLWTASQYSGANRFGYGGVIGGYRGLFSGASGAEVPIRAFVVFFVVLPALAPLFGLLGLLAARKLWNRQMLFLALCTGSAVIACAPRMDVAHLTYALPLSLILAACTLQAVLPRFVRTPLVVLLSIGACTMAWSAIGNRMSWGRFEARAGTVYGTPADIKLLQELESSVQPDEGFFAFPYAPLTYFLTDGANPTHYSFLQPGMMGDHDERLALAALERTPPPKILYMDVGPESLLRLWPSSDPTRLRMKTIEAWIRHNYRCQESRAGVQHGDYFLCVRASQETGMQGTAATALPAAPSELAALPQAGSGQ